MYRLSCKMIVGCLIFICIHYGPLCLPSTSTLVTLYVDSNEPPAAICYKTVSKLTHWPFVASDRQLLSDIILYYKSGRRKKGKEPIWINQSKWIPFSYNISVLLVGLLRLAQDPFLSRDFSAPTIPPLDTFSTGLSSVALRVRLVYYYWFQAHPLIPSPMNTIN